MSNILNRPGWTNKSLSGPILEMARKQGMPIVELMQQLIHDFLMRKEIVMLRGTPRETVFCMIRKEGFSWLTDPPFPNRHCRVNVYMALPPKIKAKADRDLLKLAEDIKDDSTMLRKLVALDLTKPHDEAASKRKELAIAELTRQQKISEARVNKLDADVKKIVDSIDQTEVPEDLLHYILPVMFARLSYNLQGEDIEMSTLQQVMDQLESSIVRGEEAFAETILDIVDSDNEEESRIAVFVYKAYKNAIKEVTTSAKLGPSFRKGLRASENTPDSKPDFNIDPRPENSEHSSMPYPSEYGEYNYKEEVKISQTKQNQLLAENYRQRRQHQYRINEKYNKQ